MSCPQAGNCSGPSHKPPKPPTLPLNLEIHHKLLLPHRPGPPVAVFQLGGLGADLIEGGNAGGDEHVAPDGGPPADDSIATEDGGAGVDGHIVLDGRVAFLTAQKLTEAGGEGAQGHALVDFDVVADLGGFADDDA